MNLNQETKMEFDQLLRQQMNRQIKPISDKQLREFGLSKDNISMQMNLEELRKKPMNIVIAECLKNIDFFQNHFKRQSLRKGKKYVMGLGVFQQLHFDSNKNVKILRPSNVKLINIYRTYIGQNLNGKTI